MSKIVEVKGKEELQKVLSENKAVLLDFYADWCGPCVALGKKIKEEYIEKSNGWIVVKLCVDHQENQEICQQHQISGIPQVNLYIDGKDEGKFVGYNEEELKKFIEKAASKY